MDLLWIAFGRNLHPRRFTLLATPHPQGLSFRGLRCDLPVTHVCMPARSAFQIPALDSYPWRPLRIPKACCPPAFLRSRKSDHQLVIWSAISNAVRLWKSLAMVVHAATRELFGQTISCSYFTSSSFPRRASMAPIVACVLPALE
jgi:hypothetical protein